MVVLVIRLHSNLMGCPHSTRSPASPTEGTPGDGSELRANGDGRELIAKGMKELRQMSEDRSERNRRFYTASNIARTLGMFLFE
jgi:hypothetical protein